MHWWYLAYMRQSQTRKSVDEDSASRNTEKGGSNQRHGEGQAEHRSTNETNLPKIGEGRWEDYYPKEKEDDRDVGRRETGVDTPKGPGTTEGDRNGYVTEGGCR